MAAGGPTCHFVQKTPADARPEFFVFESERAEGHALLIALASGRGIANRATGASGRSAAGTNRTFSLRVDAGLCCACVRLCIELLVAAA